MNINLTNMHKDQRGILPLLLIFLILGVVGVGGFAYWRISSYNNNNDTGSPTNNSATLSEECVAQTGDANICRLGAITDLSQYASEIQVTMQGAESSLNVVVKYDGKGNTQMDGDLQSITIGSKNYVYIFDNWYDTGGDASQVPENPAKFGIATTAGITYENQGKEPCGDATCFRYRMTGGILGDGVVVVLFSDKDYLPRYYETTGGLTGNMIMKITYKPVTITAPAGALPISSLVPGS